MARSEVSQGWRVPAPPEEFTKDAHPLIRPAADAFARSFYRIYGVGRLLDGAVVSGQRYQRACAFALEQELGRPYLLAGESLNFDLRSAARTAFQEYKGFEGRVNGGPVDTDAVWAEAEKGNPEGVHAMLGAFVLMGWTAFESFAVDAWLATVNARPTTLAVNVITAGRSARPKDAKGQQETSVPLQWLADAKFDLRAVVGDWLKEKNFVSLASFEGIKKAYECAFLLPNGKPVTALADAFAAEYADVRILEAVRNLLAHQAGIVDLKFIGKVKSHSVELGSLVPKSVLPLTSDMVRKHVGAAVRLAVQIGGFLGRWLEGHLE